jgi:hypothetical protein
MSVSIKAMQYFLAAAEQGSIVKASKAAQCGAISRLERN